MDILIITLVLIYLVIATISDMKTQEIPDSLNYSFIAIGLFIYLIKTLTTGEITYILSSALTLGAFLVIGNIMYYTKQWGGGDLKLLMGLGALLPIYPNIVLENFPIMASNYFGLDLFLNILLVGSIYALLFAIYLGIKNRKQFSKKFKEEYSKKKVKTREKIFWALIILTNILSFFLLETNIVKIFVLSMSILFLLLNYLLITVKAIEDISMYLTIDTKKLREGDAITKELKADSKIIYQPSIHGVTKKQIPEIQKHFDKVEIKNGIAFALSFLIGTILTLIFGNLFLYLLP
jgi:Flp pilus assembly protein protease CpaA